MSATNRGTVRNEADYYPTPLWVTRALVKNVALPFGRWVEPCAGDGHIIKLLNGNAIKLLNGNAVDWHAVELREECVPRLRSLGIEPVIGDARNLTGMGLGTFDVAITNPPFSIWPDIVRAMHSVADQTVVLLRMGACIKQDALLADLGMPDIYVLPDRPSFTGKGTDATEYAWHRWTKEKRSAGEFRVLPRVPLSMRKGAP